MDMNASLGNDAFVVCFIPAVGASLRLSAPLHIGEPLAEHDEALDLAEVAAAQLPGYGFPRGEVRVMRNAAVVQTLPTAHGATSHPSPSSARAGRDQVLPDRLQREVARMALEDLQQQVSRATPTQTAPLAWIACLGQAQQVIAISDDQPQDPLDGQPCVTVDTLHQRVIILLHQFD